MSGTPSCEVSCNYSSHGTTRHAEPFDGNDNPCDLRAVIHTGPTFPAAWRYSHGSARDHAVEAFLHDHDVAVDRHVRLTDAVAQALADLTRRRLDTRDVWPTIATADEVPLPRDRDRCVTLTAPGAPQPAGHAYPQRVARSGQ